MGKDRQNATYRNKKSYQHMNDIGFDNFYIELICPSPCNNIEELHSREGEWIRQMGTLNQIVSGWTPRQYREDNEDKLREQKQQYREQNKDKIKQYRERNKDKMREQNQQNREKNSHTCTCVCGSVVNELNL